MSILDTFADHRLFQQKEDLDIYKTRWRGKYNENRQGLMTIDQVLRDFLLPPSFSLLRLLSRCTYRRGSKSMLTDRTIGIYAICKDIFVIYSCPFLCCVSWSRCIDLLEVWKSSRVAPQFTASCCWWSNFMRSFPIHLVNYTSQSTVIRL